jgi:nickel-dependent lactate racemase
LSGLKTKNVNITASSSANNNANQASEDKGSTISISELKDLQNDNMPNKTKRKPKSERNTISLDI